VWPPDSTSVPEVESRPFELELIPLREGGGMLMRSDARK